MYVVIIRLGLGDFCDYANNCDVVFIIVTLMSSFPQSGCVI